VLENRRANYGGQSEFPERRRYTRRVTSVRTTVRIFSSFPNRSGRREAIIIERGRALVFDFSRRARTETPSSSRDVSDCARSRLETTGDRKFENDFLIRVRNTGDVYRGPF